MRRWGKMVFVVVATICLSQDIGFLSQPKREVSKVYVVKSSVPPKTSKNIDDLFINFLLR